MAVPSFQLPGPKPSVSSGFFSFSPTPHPIQQQFLLLNFQSRSKTCPLLLTSSAAPGLSHHRLPPRHLQWVLTALPHLASVLLQSVPCAATRGIHSNLSQIVSLEVTPLHGSVTLTAQGKVLQVTSTTLLPTLPPHSLFCSRPASFQIHKSTCAHVDPRTFALTAPSSPKLPWPIPSPLPKSLSKCHLLR